MKKLLSLILRLASALYDDITVAFVNPMGFISNCYPENEFVRDFISSMLKEYCFLGVESASRA